MFRREKKVLIPGVETEEGQYLPQKQIRIWILTLISWLGLSMDLNYHGMTIDTFDPVRNWLGSIRGFDPVWAFLIPGIYLVYKLVQTHRIKQNSLSRQLLAGCFALIMVLGFAFEKEGCWDMLLGIRDGQLAKATFVWVAWYFVWRNILALVFHMLENLSIRIAIKDTPGFLKPGEGLRPIRLYSRMLQEHPFGSSFCTLLILILPCVIFSYPAMFMGDTGSIIVQAYSELNTTGTDYLSPDSVIKAGVYINQHHPAFYTLLLHGFLAAGDGLFRSLNAGVFMYVICQALLMIAAFSYAVSTLIQHRMRIGYGAAILCYVLIHPQIHNYLVLVTKEGLYSSCFLLMMTSVFRLRFRETAKKEIVMLVLSALGVILLRNEGRYVLLLSGILMALTDPRNRKVILGFTVASLLISIGIYNGLYIYLGYTPGSTREMLSVPFQQTARCIRDHPEDITEEEKAAIDRVLDYDALASAYVAEIADPVKATFREESTTEDLLRYFSAWSRMLIRHPGTYIQAFCTNYDQFLYPGNARMYYYTYGWMENICRNTNELILDLGKSFSLPEWSRRFRTLADSFTEAGLLNFPPLSFLMTPAIYSLSLMAALGWTVGRKVRRNPAIFAQIIPAFVILLALFSGPANGFYGRYMLPLTMYLPVMLLMLSLLREQEGKTGEAETVFAPYRKKEN